MHVVEPGNGLGLFKHSGQALLLFLPSRQGLGVEIFGLGNCGLEPIPDGGGQFQRLPPGKQIGKSGIGDGGRRCELLDVPAGRFLERGSSPSFFGLPAFLFYPVGLEPEKGFPCLDEGWCQGVGHLGIVPAPLGLQLGQPAFGKLEAAVAHQPLGVVRDLLQDGFHVFLFRLPVTGELAGRQPLDIEAGAGAGQFLQAGAIVESIDDPAGHHLAASPPAHCHQGRRRVQPVEAGEAHRGIGGLGGCCHQGFFPTDGRNRGKLFVDVHRGLVHDIEPEPVRPVAGRLADIGVIGGSGDVVEQGRIGNGGHRPPPDLGVVVLQGELPADFRC